MKNQIESQIPDAFNGLILSKKGADFNLNTLKYREGKCKWEFDQIIVCTADNTDQVTFTRSTESGRTHLLRVFIGTQIKQRKCIIEHTSGVSAEYELGGMYGQFNFAIRLTGVDFDKREIQKAKNKIWQAKKELISPAEPKATRGGSRPGSGRKKEAKINKTFSIDQSIANRKPTSALVNRLLEDYYQSNPK